MVLADASQNRWNLLHKISINYQFVKLTEMKSGITLKMKRKENNFNKILRYLTCGQWCSANGLTMNSLNF